MTEEELQARLEETTPERDRYELFVEESQDQDVRVRFSPPPGEGWSTAALLTAVETSLRAAAGVEASVTHLNVTRLRPAHPADIIALSRVIRRDGAVVHGEVWLFSHAVVEAMLHATASLVTRG
jgi:acyl-coenzyme A thioesterase PaaI-like protein